MARLIYGMGEVSLDGYVAAADGRFSWTEPGADLHRHAAAELDRAGTLVYGRKMYDLMVYWETADRLPDAQPADIAFATAWQRPDKIVASRTLTEPRSARTRIVADLSPDCMRQLETSGDGEVTSKRIGEMVMEGLKGLDSVAYIRFASVYRDFNEAKDFEEFAGSVEEAGRE